MKKIILFPLGILPFASAIPALATETSSSLAAGDCSFCHFCPAPLGFCLLWWLAAALLFLLILVYLCTASRTCPVCGRRNRRSKNVCPECGYDRKTDEMPDAAIGVIFSDRAAADPLAQKNFSFRPESTAPAEPAAPVEPTSPVEPAAPVEPASPVEPAAEETPVKKFCIQCGAELPGQARFCGRCGAKQ